MVPPVQIYLAGMQKKPISTCNSEFKEGDTSPTQCNNPKMDDKQAKKIFNEIDSRLDNNYLDYLEICNYRDKECDQYEKENLWHYVVTFLNRNARRNYLKNKEQIEQWRTETNNYRNNYRASLEIQIKEKKEMINQLSKDKTNFI